MAEDKKQSEEKVETKKKTELKESEKKEMAPKTETKKAEKKSVPKKTAEKKPAKKEKKPSKNVIFTVGKRKIAVARCTIKPGTGRVIVNSTPVDLIQNEVLRLMISEPLLVMGGDKWKSYDFRVNMKGGGVMGQAEAARQSIARGLVEIFGEDIKKKFLSYNRAFLVYDPRRTEPHKPPRSSQGPRRYKQRSKR